LSDDKQIFVYNLYIAESNNLTGEKEFEYSKNSVLWRMFYKIKLLKNEIY
jgi:hypothetical protein